MHRGRVELRLNCSTVAARSRNGLTNTRCCRYSCMCSWWWESSLEITLKWVSWWLSWETSDCVIQNGVWGSAVDGRKTRDCVIQVMFGAVLSMGEKHETVLYRWCLAQCCRWARNTRLCYTGDVWRSAVNGRETWDCVIQVMFGAVLSMGEEHETVLYRVVFGAVLSMGVQLIKRDRTGV